jgi:hypothetical protein
LPKQADGFVVQYMYENFWDHLLGDEYGEWEAVRWMIIVKKRPLMPATLAT